MAWVDVYKYPTLWGLLRPLKTRMCICFDEMNPSYTSFRLSEDHRVIGPGAMVWCVLCAVPVGIQWASRACAHKYLGLWKINGVLERVLVALQEICIEWKMIDLTRLAIDGFFSSEKGGGEKVDHGYKGKGITTHLLVDGLGQPLATTSSGASVVKKK